MGEPIPVRVLFFAQAREITKLSQEVVLFSSKPYTAKDILDNIIIHYPSLKPLEQCVILARNQTYLDLESEELIVFNSNEELAVIPPISAGKNLFGNWKYQTLVIFL